MAAGYSEELHDVAHFNFESDQARRLDEACLRVAAEGGLMLQALQRYPDTMLSG